MHNRIVRLNPKSFLKLKRRHYRAELGQMTLVATLTVHHAASLDREEKYSDAQFTLTKAEGLVCNLDVLAEAAERDRI